MADYLFSREAPVLEDLFDKIAGLPDEVQEKLRSGENIKTINGKSILGEGNLEVKHPYISLERLYPYLYKVTFDSLPEDNGGDNPVMGGCSTYVANGELRTNLDWGYAKTAGFRVITKDFEGMSFINGLDDGQMNDALIAQLPYRMRDGANNHGIKVATHVLFNDWQWTGCGDKSINITRLPFLVLSRVKSMATLAQDLNGVLDNLYAPEGLLAMGYLIQFVVTDGTTIYAIIPPTSEGESYEVMDITECPKLTNFRPVGRETVARTDADMQTRPTGVERYNLMPCPLEDLRFTLAYEAPDRISEFIGIRETTKDSSDAALRAIYREARAIYLERERDGQTWQTMHSVVYGPKGMEKLWIQENWNDNVLEKGDVTKAYVDSEIERVEGLIPDVSGFATRTELQTETSRATGVEDNLSTAIANEVTRARNAESELNERLGGVERNLDTFGDIVTHDADEFATAAQGTKADTADTAINKVVGVTVAFSEDGSTVKCTISKVNIKTGATSSEQVSLPVADANSAGVMNPQTYQTVQSNQTLINALLGASVAVTGLAAEPTQTQVTNAWRTATGLTDLINGSRVFDVTNQKVWTYYSNDTTWHPVAATGQVEISAWTNTSLGTVKGSADNASHSNDGKITAETDGTGSVLGWDRLGSRVENVENAPAVQDSNYVHTDNNYSDTEKAKVAGAAQSADLAEVATTGDYDDLSNTPNIPTTLADLSGDSTHRVVTDEEKIAWNAKIGDAPSDGKQYVRKDGDWSEVEIPAQLPLSVVNGKLCITFNQQ